MAEPLNSKQIQGKLAICPEFGPLPRNSGQLKALNKEQVMNKVGTCHVMNKFSTIPVGLEYGGWFLTVVIIRLSQPSLSWSLGFG